MTAVARAAITGGTLSAAGEALHRLPAIEAAALDLRRADQVDPLDDAGKGPLKPLVGADHHARRRRADHEGAGLLADPDHARDALRVDDQIGLQPPALQLHQQIGPAGQDLCQTGGARPKP